MKRLIHTPEGVRDIYSNECERKEYLQKQIQGVFDSYGYQDIETPTFEYFDVFGSEVGTTPSGDLFKFFDKDGHTLALRPDFTPSIARAVSMYYAAEDMPVRLSYAGPVFVNSLNYRGRLKESTQMGVELIGDESAFADAEVLAMTIQSMRTAGLDEFQVSIGQVEYFKALVAEARLTEEQTIELRELISIKNEFGVEVFLEKLAIPQEMKLALSSVAKMFGGEEILDRAQSVTKNKTALAALKRLRDIYRILRAYGLADYVVFDFGLLSKFKYYTGIIFQAYTYQTGEAIVTGGRYDTLLGHFGKPRAAVGFTVLIDQMLLGLTRQGIELPVRATKTMILYPDFMEEQAAAIARGHREAGLNVSCIRFERKRTLDEYKAYGRRMNFGGIVYLQSAEEVFAINLGTDEVTALDINQLMPGEKEGHTL